MSTKSVACEVEFVGGPIDGCVESLDYPPAPFVIATTYRPWRIGDWVRRLLSWNSRPPAAVIYELQESAGRLRYRHAGSCTRLSDATIKYY
jgi:hypothetical protein